ncbi:MAG TPA: Na+/H+ antiporter subunit G [Chloroflexi bacterium]|nr:Na+/H+ antiporter subunit G [Chloroflexota bacterium]HHW86105.1 monovalent cation/H(+) antiporter subunit G [Chloroflexota bacterium]
MTTVELIIAFLILAGALFMLIGALGIVRFPDVLSRMHAAGMATTVGISAILLGAGFFFRDEFLFYRMLVLILLLFATSPISTTALTRAVYNNEPILRRQLKHDEMAVTVLDESMLDESKISETKVDESANGATSANPARMPTPT